MTPVYDRSKYFRILERAQSNYINQMDRLSRAEKRSSIIVIYYSIALIVYALTLEFFNKYVKTDILQYSSIVLSVIILTFSIISSNANYPLRIESIRTALFRINTLKRQVGEIPDAFNSHCCKCAANPSCNKTCSCKKLEQIKKEYTDVINNTEYRDNLDFYFTLCALCKQYGVSTITHKKLSDEKYIKELFERIEKETKANGQDSALAIKNAAIEISEIKQYIAEIGVPTQIVHMLIQKFKNFVLYIAPIAIMAISVKASFIWRILAK